MVLLWNFLKKLCFLFVCFLVLVLNVLLLGVVRFRRIALIIVQILLLKVKCNQKVKNAGRRIHRIAGSLTQCFRLTEKSNILLQSTLRKVCLVPHHQKLTSVLHCNISWLEMALVLCWSQPVTETDLGLHCVSNGKRGNLYCSAFWEDLMRIFLPCDRRPCRN